MPLHGEGETDAGAAHKAAGSGTEKEDAEFQDDSDVINGLVLFEPGPPPTGLKS